MSVCLMFKDKFAYICLMEKHHVAQNSNVCSLLKYLELSRAVHENKIHHFTFNLRKKIMLLRFKENVKSGFIELYLPI